MTDLCEGRISVARTKRARRANGEGGVWERPDTGRIQASVVVGWTPKGNARRVSKSFDTKEQARAWIAEQQVALSRGARLDDTATLHQVFDEWVTSGETLRRWAPATAANYRAILGKHVLPRLGRARVRDITPGDVRSLLRDLAKGNGDTAGASPAMFRRVRSYLGMVLRDARRLGIITTNPVENVTVPAAPEPRVQRWSEDEVARVVRACIDRDDQAARYVLVALGTGLRTEELLGLTWDAVDLQQRLVTIQQVATAAGSKELRAGAKTSSGQRVVPIDAFTEAQLRRQREHVDELQRARLALNEKRAAKRLEPLPWADLNLVFCTSVGTILDRGTLRRHVNEIQTAAGVTRIKLYATRSTHGSLLADAGVNLHALAERLGQSDPRFTAKVYLRGSSTAHRAVADQVGAILEAGARCSSVAVGTENPVQAAPEGSTPGPRASAGTSLETLERPN